MQSLENDVKHFEIILANYINQVLCLKLSNDTQRMLFPGNKLFVLLGR